MRTLAILILFCTSLYGADITTTNIVGDITTKVSERLNEDGKPDLRIETEYRGKMEVLQTVSRRNKKGKLVIYSRAYFADGRLHMVESDDNGDGFLEAIMVFDDPMTDDFEMFTRQADGSVKPVSTEELQKLKKKAATANERLREMLQQIQQNE